MIPKAFLVIVLAIRYHILPRQWLATVGTARCHLVEITCTVVGRPLIFLKTLVGDWSAAPGAHKMLWMPYGTESIEIVTRYGSSAPFTDKLW
jgi:hypothetical protein